MCLSPCAARREALIKRLGRGPYLGLFSLVAIVGLVLIGYRLCAISRRRADPAVVSAGMDAPHRGRADVAGEHLRSSPPTFPATSSACSSTRCWSALSSGPSRTFAPTAIVGGIILFGSVLAWAGLRPHHAQAPQRPGAPPIPIGGRRNDIIAIVVGTILYLALGFVFHPIVIGLPAFGTPALGALKHVGA